MNRQLIEYLRGFISEDRWKRINEVLDKRTEHITVVLEDIYQPHNASAVLRSCDGFGIQNVHVIENKNTFDASSEVTIGADQWLSIHRYNKANYDNVNDCFSKLKEQGFQIVATTPHENDHNLIEMDITKPTALVFGTELDGVSDKVMKQSDGFIKIPMSGFSESFNISVSAAICLYDTSTRMKNSVPESVWNLTENRREELLLEWVKKSIKAGDQLSKKWLAENKP